MAVNGLRVEKSKVPPYPDVCAWYKNGERRAVLYVENDTLILRHENDVEVQVLKRIGHTDFEEVET